MRLGRNLEILPVHVVNHRPRSFRIHRRAPSLEKVLERRHVRFDVRISHGGETLVSDTGIRVPDAVAKERREGSNVGSDALDAGAGLSRHVAHCPSRLREEPVLRETLDEHGVRNLVRIDAGGDHVVPNLPRPVQLADANARVEKIRVAVHRGRQARVTDAPEGLLGESHLLVVAEIFDDAVEEFDLLGLNSALEQRLRVPRSLAVALHDPRHPLVESGEGAVRDRLDLITGLGRAGFLLGLIVRGCFGEGRFIWLFHNLNARGSLPDLLHSYRFRVQSLVGGGRAPWEIPGDATLELCAPRRRSLERGAVEHSEPFHVSRNVDSNPLPGFGRARSDW